MRTAKIAPTNLVRNFHREQSSPQARLTRMKLCECGTAISRRAKHCIICADRIQQESKRRYRETHREQESAYSRKYYLEHRQERLDAARERYRRRKLARYRVAQSTPAS